MEATRVTVTETFKMSVCVLTASWQSTNWENGYKLVGSTLGGSGTVWVFIHWKIQKQTDSTITSSVNQDFTHLSLVGVLGWHVQSVFSGITTGGRQNPTLGGFNGHQIDNTTLN